MRLRALPIALATGGGGALAAAAARIGAAWAAPGGAGGGGAAWGHPAAQEAARGLATAVVDVRGQRGQQRRRAPYFNADDGPEAYDYWRDLWRAAPHPRRVRRRPTLLPVYLEPHEQDALLAAAVAAGVPAELARGAPGRRVPRLIAAVLASGGRIPTDPAALAERVAGLLELERSVPGLDVRRIWKAHGFGILASSPKRVAHQASFLSRRLSAAGVPAEAGLLLTAAVKPALKYPVGLINRAQQLPAAFEKELGAAVPAGLLQHPFAATLLNKSGGALQHHMAQLAERYGAAAAAGMCASLPQLLLYRPEHLAAKVVALADALGLEPAAADALAARHPRLLTYGADALAAKAAALGELLLAPDRATLGALVGALPALLHPAPDTLAGRGGDRGGAARKPRPALPLGGQPRGRRQRATGAAAALGAGAAGGPRGGAAGGQPRLLALGGSDGGDGGGDAEPRSLAGRLRQLEALAELGPGWRALVEAWAGGSAADAAATLGHPALPQRLAWLLAERPEAPQGASLHALVVRRAARLTRVFPGFANAPRAPAPAAQQQQP
ncbi:hypothetical protein HT031_006490 [Scenedesmus sp. PABB004]|nr:hypothetical protein HT031_006490 [Scenedesmus sp. PABB004]